MKILSIAVCVGHIGFHGPRVKKRRFARLCNACLASTVERLLLPLGSQRCYGFVVSLRFVVNTL